MLRLTIQMGELILLSKQRSLGFVSFITLIIGTAFITIYLTGDTLIDDNVTMIASLIFLAITLILSALGKGNVLGKISLYVSALLLGVFVVFFVGMSLLWNTP